MSRNGFPDDIWKDAHFQWHTERVAASAKVYFPGQHAIRLVTTFYTYLQLTPNSTGEIVNRPFNPYCLLRVIFLTFPK
jgi:hypothetical protein